MVRRRRTATGDDTEINITPMLDIVFIMLIFFIVSTSFIRETGIDPVRPEAATATRQERGNILIAIADDGQIWMDKRQVELAQVRTLVERARAENPESSVIIIADDSSASGRLLDLMDQVNAGGITNVSIAARPGEG